MERIYSTSIYSISWGRLQKLSIRKDHIMFGIFKKASAKQSLEEENERVILHHYEGSVISAEYNVDDPDEYPFHALYPQGQGKIVYTINGKIVETYEGEFDSAQYSGKGKLIKNGEVFEGIFKENKFVE